MADEDVKVLFGRRVRQLRKAKGVSQEAFAHEIQIDRSYFGSIERGERNVSLENICLIAKGLGVAPAQLLMFEVVVDTEQGDETDYEPPSGHRPNRAGGADGTRSTDAADPPRKRRTQHDAR